MSANQLMNRINGILREYSEFDYRSVWTKLRYGKDPIVIIHKKVQRLMQKYNLQAKVKTYDAPRKKHTGKSVATHSI